MSVGYVIAEQTLGDNSRGFDWWNAKKQQAHDKALAGFRAIENRDRGRMTDYRVYNRLYCNQDLVGFGPYDYFRRRTQERVTYNLIQAVVDTAAARITRSVPRTVFKTTAGAWSYRRKAKNLQHWMDYQRDQVDFETVAREVFLDAAVFGTGVFHLTKSRGKLNLERVIPAEIFVDPGEALYGRPKTIYRRRFVDREALLKKFPNMEEQISALLQEDQVVSYGYGRDALTDQVEVFEAWRVDPTGKDGKYIMFAKDVTFVMEKYKRKVPPFVFFNWKHRRQGFFGQGIAELLVGIQVELNRTLEKIRRAMNLMANPQIWLSMSSAIKGQRITNRVGDINFYRTDPPTHISPPAVHEQVMRYPDYLIEKGFNQVGVSMMASQQQLPPGLTAGVAIREHDEMGNARFQSVLKRWERRLRDLAELMVEMGGELARKDGKAKVQRDKYTVEEVDWSEIDMERDDYVIGIEQASALPLSQGARKQEVLDLFDRQMVDVATARRLLDWPDLAQEMSLDRAQSDLIDMHIEMMLETGNYIPPEPWMDLQLAMKRTQYALNKYSQHKDLPQKNLLNLRRYLMQVHKMVASAAMAQSQPGTALQPGVPPAPGPTGQSPTAATPADGPVPI